MLYDFSDSAAINIDSIMDAIVESRIESNVGGVPEEAIIDEETGRRYRRFQKHSKQEELIFKALKDERDGKNKASSSTGHGSRFNMRSIQGLEVYDRMVNGGDDDYDSAPTFICTYCSKLARGKKYNPVLCDSCTECLSCNQFARKECSGCEYSRWREGVPYGQLIGQTCTMDDKDMAILNGLMCDDDSNPAKDTFEDVQITGWSVTDC